MLFLCLPPPQLRSFWGEAKAAQSSRRGEALVLQQEKGFSPGTRCEGALGTEGSASPRADPVGRGKNRSALVPFRPQPQVGVHEIEMAQNRNGREQEYAKWEHWRKWEGSGKVSSERRYLRRLCLNTEVWAVENRNKAAVALGKYQLY